MAKLVVIADDFTGSNDTGVQFSKKRLETVVVTNVNEIEKAVLDSDILVVDTESRFDSPDTAYRKVYEVGKLLKTKNISHYYKKLDSTFRGNIGAEIAGAMDALSLPVAIVAAALPSNGRTTVNGKVYVNGVILEDTEVSKDPKTPVNISSISEIISAQCNKKSVNITLEDIRLGTDELLKRVQHFIDNGAEIIIADGENDDDLAIIAEVISRLKEKVLMVGSAGLAEQLVMPLKLLGVPSGSSVFIVGSVSDITREQVDYATNKNHIKVININASKIFTDDKNNEKNRVYEFIDKYTKEKVSFIIRTAETREDVKRAVEVASKMGINSSDASEKIAEFLSEITKYLVENTQISGLMMTGGDTAIKVAKALNISGTIIKDEVLPGIPWGYFLDKKYGHIPIVTKAGAFGKEDAIVKILEFFQGGVKND